MSFRKILGYFLDRGDSINIIVFLHLDDSPHSVIFTVCHHIITVLGRDSLKGKLIFSAITDLYLGEPLSHGWLWTILFNGLYLKVALT